MHGVVSLLDNQHYRIVEDLWAELEREFAVRGVYVTPYPHFSYQVAADYDIERLTPALRHIAESSEPFHVQAGGLGIFTGPVPVLFIPVVRNPHLTQFHQRLLAAIAGAGSGVQGYYQPDFWMPHITIGFGDVSKKQLGTIVSYLSERDFSWDIPVENIAYIHDTGSKQELCACFAFKGASNSPTLA